MSGEPIKVFGLVIKELRNERGFSQEALAFEAKLDRAFISQLENGHKQPSLLTIFSLATALEIEVSNLFKRIEGKMKHN